MGYLTTFTIYNDCASQIEIEPEKFVKKLKMGCDGVLTRDKDSESFGIGYCANVVTVQKPRHADDHTCYVHMGNTVVEMSPFSKETKRIMENHSQYFDDLLKHLEFTVKELKRMKKESK